LIVEPHTAGDPMHEESYWTHLSQAEIADTLSEMGTPVSQPTAGRLLEDHGFAKRQIEKTIAGGNVPERNQQFEIIEALKQRYFDQKNPVFSIDTKKKEMLGNFHRDGVTDAVDPTIVNDHDFASASNGKVIPHGIYDVAKNEASVHLNSSCDTSELACDSIELWFREQGHSDYPDATDLLVLCDGGGSNSSSHYIFKEDLQALSNRLGLKIRICHYPPYCSKYNPIEHRVFPHVTRACKGVPLETIETAKHYIEKTETTKGLKVVVRMLDKVYQTGRQYAKDFKQTMTIKFDEYLPKWNYTAIPDGR
jgi:hypothetical protein